MGKTKFILTAILILAIWTVSALAQNWIVFPAQGQSQEQMERDKYDCYTWSKQQTGFDPMQPQATVKRETHITALLVPAWKVKGIP